MKLIISIPSIAQHCSHVWLEVAGDTEPGELINVNPKFLESVWVPDFYIYDLQSFNSLNTIRNIGARPRIIKYTNNSIGTAATEKYL